MTSYLSKKLTVISFGLMVMVVVLHAHLLGYATDGLAFVQKVVTGEVTRVAVPLFFTISGFLFFRNYTRPGKAFFMKKIRKRFRSLFVPYVLFSFLGFAFTFCTALCFPNFVSGANRNIIDCDFSMICFSLFLQPVGTYQLWFIRDLFILVLLSPCVYLVLRGIRCVSVIVLFCLWVGNVQAFIHIESIFFFTLGAYIALHRKNWVNVRCSSLVMGTTLLALWLVVCVVLTLFKLTSVWFSLNVILGMLAVWFFYDTTIGTRSPTSVSPILSYSFFLYLVHEPLLTVIKKALLSMCGTSASVLTFIYLFSPLSTIVICLAVGAFLKKGCPRVYFFLTGSR